jgi:hypothetical protein
MILILCHDWRNFFNQGGKFSKEKNAILLEKISSQSEPEAQLGRIRKSIIYYNEISKQ